VGTTPIHQGRAESGSAELSAGHDFARSPNQPAIGVASNPAEQGPPQVPGGGLLFVVGLRGVAGHMVGMGQRGSSGFHRGGGFTVNAGPAVHMVGMEKQRAPSSDERGASRNIEQLRDAYDDALFAVAAAEDPTDGEEPPNLELTASKGRALQAREVLIAAAVRELGLSGAAAVIIRAVVGDGGVRDA